MTKDATLTPLIDLEVDRKQVLATANTGAGARGKVGRELLFDHDLGGSDLVTVLGGDGIAIDLAIGANS